MIFLLCILVTPYQDGEITIDVVWDESYEVWCKGRGEDAFVYTDKFMDRVDSSLENELGIVVKVNLKGCRWVVFDTTDLLVDLSRQFPDPEGIVLGITDIYDEHNGIAYLSGKYCLIDPNPKWWLYDWPEANIAKHEICHNLGAKDHQSVTRCVMNKSIPFFWTSGPFNLNLCDECKAEIKSYLTPKKWLDTVKNNTKKTTEDTE